MGGKRRRKRKTEAGGEGRRSQKVEVRRRKSKGGRLKVEGEEDKQEIFGQIGHTVFFSWK
jgi:hypothetical protein